MSEPRLYGFERSQAIELLGSSAARTHYVMEPTLSGMIAGAMLGAVSFFYFHGFQTLQTFDGWRQFFFCLILGVILVGGILWASHYENIEKLLRADRDARVLNQMRHSDKQ